MLGSTPVGLDALAATNAVRRWPVTRITLYTSTLAGTQ
jgi:hypothetical protein